MPSRPRSHASCTTTRKSANTVAVLSARLSKTLIVPDFSATKTRPSGENSMFVGCTRPLRATSSWNPGCTGVAAAGRLAKGTIASDEITTAEPSTRHRRDIEPPRVRKHHEIQMNCVTLPPHARRAEASEPCCYLRTPAPETIGYHDLARADPRTPAPRPL